MKALRPALMIKSLLMILLIAVAGSGCSNKPADIHYGSDECTHCKMMITDNRFAAQLVTDKGKAYKFDAIECMSGYLEDHPELRPVTSGWIQNFDQPGTWIPAAKSYLVQSEVIRSPMGAHILAFSSEKARENHLNTYKGTKADRDAYVN